MKKQTQNQYRQGDVLIERISSIPTAAEKQDHNGAITVALGEATGHHHTIYADRDAVDWWKESDGVQFVNLKKSTSLRHQEHEVIELPKGKYRISRQREYLPERIRQVVD